MIYRIQKFFLNQPIWAILTIVFIFAIGSYSILHLSIDAVPDITGIQVMVQTKTGSMDPEQAEYLVTYPIEIELSGIQKVEEIRSITKYGLSLVTVVFEDDMNLYLARQLVSERLQSVQKELPQGIVPQLGPISTGLSEVYMYVLNSKDSINERQKLLELRTVQDWIIKPQLKTLNGVAEVDSNGGFSKAIYIGYIPQKLNQFGIGPLTLLNSIEGIGEISGGGFIESGHQRIIVRSDNRFFNLDQIKNFPVRTYAIGPEISLRELAHIKAKEKPRIGAATFNGEETVLGTILMRIGENSREVAKEAETKIKEIFKPENVEIQGVYSRSYLVDATIQTVKKNLFEGAVLVIVILFLLVGNLRAAIIVSLAIPLSMLIAFFGMVSNKITANLMSLGAIDFGLIVDGSVVIIENIIRNLEEDRQKKQKKAIILQSIKEITPAIITGVSIIIIVYVPVLFLEGIEGKMFRPMAETLIFALLGSLFIALFLMPALAYLFISVKHTEKESKINYLLKKFYKPIIEFTLRYGWYLVGLSIFLFAFAMFLFIRMPSEFVPNLDEQDLVIGIVRNPEISLEEMVEKQKLAEKIILEFPEVSHVFSRIGIPESATDPMGINFADTFIILQKDKSKWRKNNKGENITKQELFFLIRDKIQQHPLLKDDELSPTQPIEMRFNEMLEGSRADISLRIFGPNLDVLFELIETVKNQIQANLEQDIKEITQDELSALTRTPVLQFESINKALVDYGIKQNDLNKIFEISMAGMPIGFYYENNIKFPIIFIMDDYYRNNINYVKQIPVDLPEGGVISFNQLAKSYIKQNITTISRINTKRYAAISIYLKNRDVEGFVKKAQPIVENILKDHKDYYYIWAGQYKNLQRAKERFMILIPLTILVIVLLLYQNLKSLVHTLLILTAIPLASIGGIFLLWIRDIPFSVSASIGFIALSGIAILNGIVLINFFNELKQHYNLREVVIQGTLIRLRPVLMTALVAALGFIPMALNTGVGSEVQRPLATIVVGGLISSTILTLLILPFLYYKVEHIKNLIQQKKG
jgi:cobalt-zinc-cadmium resistance protein CzcA